MYNSNIINDLENLLYDFFVYRKNKKENEIKIKNYDLPYVNPVMLENNNSKQVVLENNNSKQVILENNNQEAQQTKSNSIITEIKNIVQEVLNEFENNGHLASDQTEINREILNQITQKIIFISTERISELKNILSQTTTGALNISHMLIELVESLVQNFHKKSFVIAKRNILNNYLPY